MGIHASKAPTQQEMIKRIAYWISTLLLILVVSIAVDAFPISRTIPLHTIPHLFDVRSTFGVALRTDPYSCYPSGHTLAYSLLVLMAFRRYPKMGSIFLLMAILMLPIRLILGIHWITDMLLGSLPLALLINAVVWKVAMLHNFSVTERAMVFAFQQIPRRPINK
jgi:membrane-associated phospholipid phosphatase